MAAAAAVWQQWQQRLWQHCSSLTAVAVALAACWQRGSSSLVAAAELRQRWQRQRWQHCNSTRAVAAVMAAWQRQLGGGAAAAARCRLRQRGSGGSGGGSSSVTAQRRWRGIGSLFDFGISLLVASLGGFGCGLECGWFFGSPFISPWLIE